jgi:tetratricopeptide (TPR) repeat protein
MLSLEFQNFIGNFLLQHGINILNDTALCKALLLDFAKDKFDKEIRLFLQALKLGCHTAILNSTDFNVTRMTLIKRLHDKHFIREEIAASLIDMLLLVLKGYKTKEKPEKNNRIENNAKYSTENISHLNQGDMYSKNGDYDKAITEYTQAIRFDPNNDVAYTNRGLAYLRAGNYDKALKDFNKVIRLVANDAGAYNNRGKTYLHKDDYDKAIKDFNKAIRFAHNDAGAYNNRGMAYLNKDDFNEALKDFDKAISLNPNSAYVYRNRGAVYVRKANYDKAIKDFTQAIHLNPNSAYAYCSRGAVYVRKADYDKAIKDFEMALKIDPNDSRAQKAFNDALSYRNCGAEPPI